MVIDTSALVAVIVGEPGAERYLDAMSSASSLSLSAATLLESSIVVAARQGVEAAEDLGELIAEVLADVVPVDEEQVQAALGAWLRFGKGRHPASLNFGDCFSYALAATRGEALLFKGRDFAQTDIPAVLS